MPFLDANASLATGDWDEFDHVIVGAGAAGLVLALSLARRGQRILVLESGHLEPDTARQALNQIEETGKPLGDALWVRKRIIGGTTTAWGGQSLPFSPLDFENRDWVKDSGWPLSYAELEPFYGIANQFMGIDQANYDTDVDRMCGTQRPAFDPDLIHCHYSKWAIEPNFRKLHGAELKARVTLLYNCQLLRIHQDEDGSVRQVEVSNFRDQRRRIAVRNLILAAGGLETVRILLLNDHQQAFGLGNGSGWLGKGFMEHPCVEVGSVTASNLHDLQAALGTRVRGRRRFGTRLSAGRAWQGRTRSLNVSASLLWKYPGGEIGPLAQLRSFLRRPDLRLLPKIVRDAGGLARGLLALAREGFVYKPGAVGALVMMAEQSPSADSYISLGERTDRFGQRLARLNWRIGADTWDTVVAFSRVIKDELERAGLGEVTLLDHVQADLPDWQDRLSDVNHHMGGARMSSDPSRGVVTPDLQVWGVPNLYVCSAAVFPTGSHSNPTLTLLALATRLAARLAP